MRWRFALENLERASKEAASGLALLEPQGDRSYWVRIPASPGLGLIPAIHVNHNAGRFTSHGEVCYAPASAITHGHWGDYRQFWPSEVQVMANGGCGVCGGRQQPQVQPMPLQHESLQTWFELAKKTPSDFHEHVETLRDLATKCHHVTQIGIWGKPSRIALAQNGSTFVDYSPSPRSEWSELKRFLGEKFIGKEWQPGLEIDETDLLFIDTYHTAEDTINLFSKHAPKVRKYLIVHTTEIFGEKGDNGGPGILIGVRQFVHENREWTVVRQDKNNYGLIVLSRLDEDRKQPPGIIRKALNFSKALASHAASGSKLVDDETFNQRIELCLLCPERAHDVCSKCGCPIDKKASWAEQQCPADPPKWPTMQ
jgi:hypothetical protein